MKPSADKRFPSIRPCTRIYLLLIALTFLTWAIGTAELAGIWISLTVFAFALLKGQLVGDYFMGLKGIRGFWRWVIVIWLVIPGTLVSVAFLLTATG